MSIYQDVLGYQTGRPPKDRALPQGKTCNDCYHVLLCVAVKGCTWRGRKECEFYPIKFWGRSQWRT